MKAPRKDILIKQKLRKEDPIELPMDDLFFDKMHEKIMLAVEKTEIQTPTKWSKTKVFLERKAEACRPVYKKAVKIAVVSLVTSIAIGFLGVSQKLFTASLTEVATNNQSTIIQEAKQNPEQWSDLAASYQSESDFYAEVLSQRNDLATMVEIEQVLTQSL